MPAPGIRLLVSGGTAAATVSAAAPAATYTGCLSSNGQLSSLAPGASPLHPCTGSEREVHLSGITYSAGGGLTLSPSHAFSIKSAYALPQHCALGESPVLNARGTWSCAGLAPARQACPAGKFAKAIDRAGGLTCAAPPSNTFSGPDLWVTRQVSPQDTPQGTTVIVATLSLPVGTFLLQANGVGEGDNSGVKDVNLGCLFDGAGTTTSEADVISSAGFVSFSLTDVCSLASPGDIHLLCPDVDPSTHVQQIIVTALKIGTVHSYVADCQALAAAVPGLCRDLTFCLGCLAGAGACRAGPMALIAARSRGRCPGVTGARSARAATPKAPLTPGGRPPGESGGEGMGLPGLPGLGGGRGGWGWPAGAAWWPWPLPLSYARAGIADR
jgi:hypothetical protein